MGVGKSYDMLFLSGFAGAALDDEYIVPVIGWAVVYDKKWSIYFH